MSIGPELERDPSSASYRVEVTDAAGVAVTVEGAELLDARGAGDVMKAEYARLAASGLGGSASVVCERTGKIVAALRAPGPAAPALPDTYRVEVVRSGIHEILDGMELLSYIEAMDAMRAEASGRHADPACDGVRVSAERDGRAVAYMVFRSDRGRRKGGRDEDRDEDRAEGGTD